MSQSTAFLQHFLGPRESPHLLHQTSPLRPGRVNPLVTSLRLKAPASSSALLNSGSDKNHDGLHKRISKLWRKEEKKNPATRESRSEKGREGEDRSGRCLRREGGRPLGVYLPMTGPVSQPPNPPTRAQEGDKNLHHLLPFGGPQPLPLQPCPLPLPL